MARRATVRLGRRPAPALAASGDALQATYETTQGGDLGRVYQAAIIDAGLTEFEDASWPFEGEVGEHGDVLAADPYGRVLKIGDALVYMGGGRGWFHLQVAAPSRQDALALVAEFAAAYPPLYREAPDTSGTVPITFWTYTAMGPSSRMRLIDAQPWEGVQANYPSDVRGDLEHLMSGWTPGDGGQLILWQGPPGTGKTWALRALAAEWRPWAEFHYITDPDAFFVTNPDYMIDVLLSGGYEALVESDDGDPDVAEFAKDGKWRVLILEDTGELLAANAKEQQGQGLSRLLNVVDGMVGQGLKILALVTTNDELGDLHPAVRRPGRCAAQLTFGPFPPAEADVWLASAGSTAEADEPLTLAELYALAHEEPDDEAAAELRASADWYVVGPNGERGEIVAADLAAAFGCDADEAVRRFWSMVDLDGRPVRDELRAFEIRRQGVRVVNVRPGRSAAEALVAGAVVATSEKGREIGRVAEQHAPDGGYGNTAWNAATGTVFWVYADWSTDEEVAACRDAFMAIDGVENVEYEAEAALPEGDDWEVVYTDANAQATLDEVVGLARLPLDRDLA